MSLKISIAGITSKLAQLVAAELLSRSPNVQIWGSSRNPNKLPSTLKDSPRITLLKADPYDTSAVRELVRGADVVICCYFADNETMLSGQKLLIDLCEEEKVPRYIASDYTLDYRGLQFGDVPLKDPMKHIQLYLETKTSVKGVHILVGIFMETFWSAFGIFDAKNKTFKYWGDGTAHFEMTSIKGVADFVSAVALDKDAVGFLKFRGDKKSLLEIAEGLESMYGLKIALELRQSSGSDHPQEEQLNTLYKLFEAGTIGLGDDLDNGRYPYIKPDTIQEYIAGRSMEQLANGEFDVSARTDLAFG